MKIAESLHEFLETKTTQRKYIYVPENITTAYPIKECMEPLIKVKEYFKEEKVSIQCKNNTILRKTAAKLLLKAAKKLPANIQFKISEGFRSLKTQKRIFKQILSAMEKKYPNENKKNVWDEATKYIADPTLYPPHTTGGAIDITIVNKNNKEINMGVPLNSVYELSNTFNPKIKDQHKKNRLILF